MTTSLATMRVGQQGMVVELHGRGRMRQQLEAMGVRPGVMITKRSGQPLRGPVTLQVGRTEVAVGYRIAQRIVIEVAQ